MTNTTKKSVDLSTANMLRRACYATVERMAAQGHTAGKRRDAAAFEFVCGIATGLQLAGHPEAQHVIGYINMVISVRGYAEIERVALSD